MKKSFFLLLIVLSSLFSQERSGLFVGAQYEMTSHTNPYIFLGGTDPLKPSTVKYFNDNTSHIYFPFGTANYSKKGYSEFSTYAFHQLFVGLLNLISPQKEYAFTTDKTYAGDSYADGYVPVFGDAGNIGKKHMSFNSKQALEASFTDMDLLRMAYSGTMKSLFGVPLMLGFQGGLGNFGVHFAKIQEGHSPSPLNNSNNGLVNFNDAVDLYYGLNTGFVTSLASPDDLLMLQLQYDRYYFIKGVEENSQHKGSKITIEASYFPYSADKDSFLKNMFFKFFVKHSSVPYMKKFSEHTAVDYSFTKIGIGINVFIL